MLYAFNNIILLSKCVYGIDIMVYTYTVLFHVHMHVAYKHSHVLYVQLLSGPAAGEEY